MHILQRGRPGAQDNVISTPVEEGNGINHTRQIVLSKLHIGTLPRVSDYCRSDVWIAIWNCRGIARASFHQHLKRLLSVTRAAVTVVTDIIVEDENTRELLRKLNKNEPWFHRAQRLCWWSFSSIGLIKSVLGAPYVWTYAHHFVVTVQWPFLS